MAILTIHHWPDKAAAQAARCATRHACHVLTTYLPLASVSTSQRRANTYAGGRHRRSQHICSSIGRQDHRACSDLHVIIEMDHIDIEQADASRRAPLADHFGQDRAMDADLRVDFALVELESARTQRIALSTGYAMNVSGVFRKFGEMLARRHPYRPPTKHLRFAWASASFAPHDISALRSIGPRCGHHRHQSRHWAGTRPWICRGWRHCGRLRALL